MRVLILVFILIRFWSCQPDIWEVSEEKAKDNYLDKVVEVAQVNKDNLFEVMIDTIFFDNSSSKIKPTQYIKLHYIATLAREFQNYYVKITGYKIITALDINFRHSLSYARAKEVYNFLNKNYDINPEGMYFNGLDIEKSSCQCAVVYLTNIQKQDDFPRKY